MCLIIITSSSLPALLKLYVFRELTYSIQVSNSLSLLLYIWPRLRNNNKWQSNVFKIVHDRDEEVILR